MSQNLRFLEILKQRPVNSYEPLRQQYLQMPRIVKDLKEKNGYFIDCRPEKNGSTTYILIGHNQRISSSPVVEELRKWQSQPKQENLF